MHKQRVNKMKRNETKRTHARLTSLFFPRFALYKKKESMNAHEHVHGRSRLLDTIDNNKQQQCFFFLHDYYSKLLFACFFAPTECMHRK
mmetsp:Transcript_155/g.307  ORF Transcript_155/g.307 Transcript_155/m.307 type:complete len:89 (-) Transcript_155:283-549(-)